jgi:tetratricopeptide (TPR) repeat protein
MRAGLALGIFMLAASAPAIGQHQHGGGGGGTPARVGSVSLANPGNAQAQPHFLRGLALLHNFEYPSAIEAFQAAQKADPDFVLAYWGEAMTHNYPLWAQQDADKARAVLARLGATPAARAAKARNARERQWLDAVEALYGSGTKVERDRAYAEAMRRLHESDPADVDARAFRALSLMGLAHDGRNIPLYMQAAALLEEAVPTHPEHPGVLHYLIHAYDDPAHAPLGERAARRYAVVAPDAGHAQHMVSHIYLALGRWPEVEAANVQAMRVVNSQRAAKGRPDGHCGHYIEWHAYAVMQQGRDGSALLRSCRNEAMKQLGAQPDTSVLGGGSVLSWSDIAVRHTIESGKLPELIDLPSGRYEMARFNIAYARLMVAGKDGAEARSALAELKRSRTAIAAAMPKERPDDKETMPWIDLAVAQGEALALLAAGRRQQAIAALRTAARTEAALPVPFGPPVLQKPASELLGEQLLAAGTKAEAAEAFRAALAATPNRLLSKQGLEAALR